MQALQRLNFPFPFANLQLIVPEKVIPGNTKSVHHLPGENPSADLTPAAALFLEDIFSGLSDALLVVAFVAPPLTTGVKLLFRPLDPDSVCAFLAEMLLKKKKSGGHNEAHIQKLITLL